MARPEWMKGREIIDATEAVTINIRQHHIDEAEPLNGARCVAGRCTLQALDAAFAWYYRSKAYVAWDDNSPLIRYHLSARLIRDVVMILDDPKRPNSEIRPGLYRLLPVPAKQRLGVDRTRKPNSPRRPAKGDRGHRVMGRMTAAFHPEA